LYFAIRAQMSETSHKLLGSAVEKAIKMCGFDVRVLVLEDGMDIGVLRKEEKEK
jgi:hypothetical protein